MKPTGKIRNVAAMSGLSFQGIEGFVMGYEYAYAEIKTEKTEDVGEVRKVNPTNEKQQPRNNGSSTQWISKLETESKTQQGVLHTEILRGKETETTKQPEQPKSKQPEQDQSNLDYF